MSHNVRRLTLVLVLLLALGLVLSACQRERPAAESVTGWEGVSVVETPATTLLAPVPTAGPDTTVVSAEQAAPGLPPSLPSGDLTPPAAPAAGTPVPADGSGAVIAVGPTFDYIVQPNDTLFSIALLYETDVETLRRLNSLPDDSIQAGQILRVPGTGQPAGSVPQPGATAPAPEPTAEVIYIVQQGDTLSSIGAQFDVAWQEIAAANGIAGPTYNIFRGQRLIIPGVVPTPVPTEEVTIHVVEAGESMYSIALQYGLTLQALMQANGITNPDVIFVGQELIIPN